MSFDLINHKLTTSTTDSKGVTTWSNPVVKDTINSKGEVFNKDGKKKAKMASGCYNLTMVGVKGSCPASFNSMFSRMVLGIKLQGSTLKKKSDAVGYLPENMEVVPLTEINLKRNQKVGQHAKVHQEHCKFDKLDNEHGFRSEICFMTLRKQLPEQVSKHQAQKIQGALERYSDSVKALDESIVGLEALLKQVK